MSFPAGSDQVPWTELDKDALDETAAEVDKGWLSECPEVDIRRHFIAKRFPIKQRNNDQVVATLLAMLRSAQSKDCHSLVDSRLQAVWSQCRRSKQVENSDQGRSSFFDDFTAIAPERLVENIHFYVEALFRLLGRLCS